LTVLILRQDERLIEPTLCLALAIVDLRIQMLLVKIAEPLRARVMAGLKQHPQVGEEIGRHPHADVLLDAGEELLQEVVHDRDVMFARDRAVGLLLQNFA
jgi:hypothetical protein